MLGRFVVEHDWHRRGLTVFNVPGYFAERDGHMGAPPWQLVGALAVLAVLSALPVVLKWLRRNAQRQPQGSDRTDI